MREGAHSRIGMRWWHRATLLALFALFLMPINYRAGAAKPHGHALIQLVHEAHAGIPVHHHGVDQVRGEHRSDIADAQTGAPPIQVTAISALLPLILLSLALLALRSTIRQGSDTRPAGRTLRPEPPPPKWA